MVTEAYEAAVAPPKKASNNSCGVQGMDAIPEDYASSRSQRQAAVATVDNHDYLVVAKFVAFSEVFEVIIWLSQDYIGTILRLESDTHET